MVHSPIERYWTPDWNYERRRPLEEDIEELRATLGDAVREQMIADVPFGAFLSGGIDSTIIVGLMQQASNRPVKTFAIGFPDPKYDETSYAEMAARSSRNRSSNLPGGAEGLGDTTLTGLALRRAIRR